MTEKFTLTTDAKRRLCITAEWVDAGELEEAEGMAKHVETVPIEDIHPSRLFYTIMILTLWKAKELGHTFAEEASRPYDKDTYRLNLETE